MRYRRAEGVSETPVDDDLFLVSPATHEIVHLDPLAAALWRLLAEPKERTEIDQLFAAAFTDVAAAQLTADLDAALALLVQERLAIAL